LPVTLMENLKSLLTGLVGGMWAFFDLATICV
jgi:hypothetical protein